MQSKTEMRILFVDDEQELTNIFANYFSKRGFSVQTAMSGNDGLEKARKFSPQVIVSDFNMPDGDGVFLLEALFDEGIMPQKFIVCSGTPERFCSKANYPAPHVVVSKPVTSRDLLDIIISTDHYKSGALERRKRVRFKPDPTFQASIQFGTKMVQSPPDKSPKFRADCSALILDFSPFGGTSLAVHRHIEFKHGALCCIQIGPFDPVQAEVVHLADINDSLISIGCRFLD
jgi:CheY-like chemotaxis protein